MAGLLNGGNVGRQFNRRTGFQGAVAGASNVLPKPSEARGGTINMAKLRSIQSQKRTGISNYRVNPNGRSRFRLIMPFGGDDVPLVSANRHWLPWVKEDGTESVRPVYCYYQFGFDFCPVCALQNLLMSSRDQSLIADADQLKASNQWAAYVINRDYLAGAKDPMSMYDPKQDKVMLYASMSDKIAAAIINHLEMVVWGDATDPEKGYDFEVEGAQTTKTFNGKKVSEYTLTPFPREYSPGYDVRLLNNLKPLSEVVSYLKVDDLRKIMDPILTSLATASEVAGSLIQEFMPDYERMLVAINRGPEVEEDTIPEPEPEDEEVDAQDGYTGLGGEYNAMGQTGTNEQDTDGQGTESDNEEVGESADVAIEGEAESRETETTHAVEPENTMPKPDDSTLPAGLKTPPKSTASDLVSKLKGIGRGQQ